MVLRDRLCNHGSLFEVDLLLYTAWVQVCCVLYGLTVTSFFYCFVVASRWLLRYLPREQFTTGLLPQQGLAMDVSVASSQAGGIFLSGSHELFVVD